MKTAAIVLLLLLPWPLFSQPEKNLKEDVQKIVGNCVLFNIPVMQCQEMDFTVSSVLIIFSKKGKIQTVMFSELPKCLVTVQSKLNEDLKRDLERVKFSKKEFSNKFILALLIFQNLENSQQFKISFENTFSQIDEELLTGKEVKYFFSASFGNYRPLIKVHPSIKN